MVVRIIRKLGGLLVSLFVAAFLALAAIGTLWLVGAALGWVALGYRMVCGC